MGRGGVYLVSYVVKVKVNELMFMLFFHPV